MQVAFNVVQDVFAGAVEEDRAGLKGPKNQQEQQHPPEQSRGNTSRSGLHQLERTQEIDDEGLRMEREVLKKENHELKVQEDLLRRKLRRAINVSVDSNEGLKAENEMLRNGLVVLTKMLEDTSEEEV